MNWKMFKTIYRENETSTNITDTVSVQPENSQILTSEILQTIRGKGGVNRVVRRWWGFIVYLCNITTHSIVNGMTTVSGLIGLLGVSKIIAGAILLCAGVLKQVNIHNTGVRVWIAWTGHVIRIDAQR
jgi:hypothetical protein